MSTISVRSSLLSIVSGLLFASLVCAQSDGQRLADELRPYVNILSGKTESFALQATARFPIGRQEESIQLRFDRFDAQSFDLNIQHKDHWLILRRRSDATALALPNHQVVFLGQGGTDSVDQLAPEGITTRLISAESLVQSYASILNSGEAESISLILTGLLGLQYDKSANRWLVGGDQLSAEFKREPRSVGIRATGIEVDLALESAKSPAAVADWPGLRSVSIERVELERQLARGLRRALEIAAPSPLLTNPAQTPRKVPHGELRWIGGQRVVLLSGTPEEVGRAHGELLRVEAQRCVDSVIHTFGTVQTILTGRWFRHDLDAAFVRLAPHIPDDHRREMQALAASLEIDAKLVEAANVFPEMFHCSGFAVFGGATRDGKLYHGRVLDYMTTIGLQDSATTFAVAVKGKIPFANVGYGGFIGSVSGMNAEAISLGEMGGRGEGQWDGVPMATLMRRALEECRTLDSVMDLWKNSPRTCEYYYVFADGKVNRAVGVAAFPQSIEFILPGQSDPRLGEGIDDAVVLSAGDRLQTLRQRVKERYGKIDAEAAQWLMSRPVAMQSNLHNVLFVPADGVLYVANANHRQPAAERPYTKLDLRALLESMPLEVTSTTGQ